MTAAAGSPQSNAGDHDLGTGCGGASSPPASSPGPQRPNAPLLIVEGHRR
jgi:hypothetical protein